jgi:hypothetical protein
MEISPLIERVPHELWTVVDANTLRRTAASLTITATTCSPLTLWPTSMARRSRL